MTRACVLALLLSSCATSPDRLSDTYERGFWAGWRQHASIHGGGL